MAILMDDQAVARRVLEHIERGTTDVAPEIWREPVENYRCQQRLAPEIELVLRKAPTPYCPGAAMPAAGSYVAREAGGTPLLAVRGQDGRVRAFRNACRHRGMPLASDSGQVRGFRNSRVTFPFRRIKRLSEMPPESWGVEGLLTYVYHLFPNVLITVFSHHTNVVVLEPVAVDRTREITYSFTNRGLDPGARKAAEHDAEFVRDAGLVEDRAVVCAIQHSLGSRANEAFTYGLFEGAISHFHRCLDAALEAGRPC